jgi:heme-degrading monooxygenase HmoA
VHAHELVEGVISQLVRRVEIAADGTQGRRGLDPEQIDETLRQFQEDALSSLEAQPGFRGITVCVNRSTGQALVLELWETEAEMEQSEQVAIRAREQAVATAGPSREPIVDHYEVILHR